MEGEKEKHSLRWRHNGHYSVSNHQRHHCLLNRYSDANQRKHQSSASLALVWGIHRGPVNSPHKWPVTRKMFPFDDVIMKNPSTQHGHRWSVHMQYNNSTEILSMNQTVTFYAIICTWFICKGFLKVDSSKPATLRVVTATAINVNIIIWICCLRAVLSLLLKEVPLTKPYHVCAKINWL